MIHTFKNHNFRIELPAHWEIITSHKDNKKKPILTAWSSEDRIFFDIFVFEWKEKNLKLGFKEALKKMHLWADNYTSLDLVTEIPFYNLEGYWAKTTGYKQKKKTNGYIIYANDGVNLFIIHAYTNSNLFPKNFFTMKEIFKGFALNTNFKYECCDECIKLSEEHNTSSLANCSDYIDTEDCFQYFQNKPHTISQCR